MLSPVQIANNYVDIGTHKTKLPIIKMLVLAVFAGMFIALAGAAATIASSTIADPSTSRLINSLVFPAGLAMVMLAGSELFTGNSLIIISVLEKKAKAAQMLKNWCVVYLGNLIGSLFTAVIFVFSHVPDMYNGALAKSFINIASAKVSLSFSDAFLRGLLCNILVCIAVWIALGALSAPGKIIGLYLPIAVFVLCGFEHCVANMFYIPAAVFISGEYGIAAEGLGWGSFFLRNLLPVTLGNLVGGAVIVGCGYWFTYLRHTPLARITMEEEQASLDRAGER